MKRASKELLNEICELIKKGMTQEQIAQEFDKNGKLTPNGARWTQPNIAHYAKTHRLNKKAKLSIMMKERHASGEMKSILHPKNTPPRNDREEKILFILSMNLSRETTMEVISKLL
jgi:hypothetical protein